MGSGAEHWARVEAIDALGRSGGRAAIEELRGILDGEKECWHTRTAAIRALVTLDAVEAGPAILKLLARDRDPDVREAAIEAVGALGVTNAIKLLRKIEAEEPPLREAARRALARLARLT
jgi:HEAT repeat protein